MVDLSKDTSKLQPQTARRDRVRQQLVSSYNYSVHRSPKSLNDPFVCQGAELSCRSSPDVQTSHHSEAAMLNWISFQTQVVSLMSLREGLPGAEVSRRWTNHAIPTLRDVEEAHDHTNSFANLVTDVRSLLLIDARNEPRTIFWKGRGCCCLLRACIAMHIPEPYFLPEFLPRLNFPSKKPNNFAKKKNQLWQDRSSRKRKPVTNASGAVPSTILTNETNSGGTVFPDSDNGSRQHVKGNTSLIAWKSHGGKSKSWKRCPQTNILGPPKQGNAMPDRNICSSEFFKSPLWIPEKYVLSQRREKKRRERKLVRYHVPCKRATKEEILIAQDRIVTEKATASRKLEGDQAMQHGSLISPEQQAVDLCSLEPSLAFIRFTWVGKMIAGGGGELDHFLPLGLLLRSRWRISGFLRNDSQADVYSIFDTESCCPSGSSVQEVLEGHYFLHEYHGNCEAFAKRRQQRMRRSQDFHDGFWYGDRRMLVLKVAKRVLPFQLRKSDAEFPRLASRQTKSKRKALSASTLRTRLSYAAILTMAPRCELDGNITCRS